MGLRSIRVEVSGFIKKLFPNLALGIAVVGDVAVKSFVQELEDLKGVVIEDLRSKFNINSLKEEPLIRSYRDFCWRVGIDPTKQRPSSEALLRRVLAGRGLPRINNVVDACNLASVETFIPLGIYDISKLSGPLLLRQARRGEVFKAIGGFEEGLNEGQLVIADGEKVIHIYLHRDSDETKVVDETRGVVIIACGCPNIPKGKVLEAAEKNAEYVAKFAGGIIKEVYLI